MRYQACRPHNHMFVLALLSLFLLLSLSPNAYGHEMARGVEPNGEVRGGEKRERDGRSGGQLCEEFAVHLHPDSDPVSVANDLGLEYVKQIGSLKCHHLFRARDNDHATHVHDNIASHSSIKWFERQVLRKRSSRTIIDSELQSSHFTSLPQYNIAREKRESRERVERAWTPTDPLFSRQWHLFDNHVQDDSNFIGMNVVSAWSLATGLGVCVAIVDDGILHTHADLRDKYNAYASHNFNGDNDNILPTQADPHGTMCAGAATAATNNVCGVGVAYQANISGLRILGGNSHDAMEAAALTHMYDDNHIYSNSWGPTDDGQTLEGPGPLTLAALEDGVQYGRKGLGSIYVWAVGNGAAKGDNCNYDGYASSRYVLTVGSVDYLGHHPYYSELCAAIIISAPSSGTRGTNIITTNMHDECDEKFSGTSAAAPLVAGVVALMLEANPSLTWRDVHHVMVRTARRNDVDDTDWVENGAHHFVNHKYGFGIVDAHAAVKMSKTWKSVEKEVSLIGPIVEVNKAIPDTLASSVVSTVEILDNIKLEHVEVVFTASHPVRTDLRVVLYSPSRTPSYLSELHGVQSGYVLKIKYDLEASINVKVVGARFGPSPAAWLKQLVEARFFVVNPLTACTAPSYNVNGSIAVISINSSIHCAWNTKAKLVQEAGASAVIIAHDSRPYELDIYDSSIVIPVMMIGSPDTARILNESMNATGILSTSIVTKSSTSSQFDEWVFSTVHLWDEESKGTWSLQVYDMHSAGTGTFNRWQLRMHGTNITGDDAHPQEEISSESISESSSFSDDNNEVRSISSPIFTMLSSVDGNITLFVIIGMTVTVVAGWYVIERRRSGNGRQQAIPVTPTPV